MKKRLLLFLVGLLTLSVNANATKVLGQPVASADRMYQFVKARHPETTLTYTIAQLFHDIGAKYGIRGDIAFCQSIIETGWFCYTGGTAMRAYHYNYGGMGCTYKGQLGEVYSNETEGVNAMLQHDWSYATTAALPSGWTLVDRRFNHGYRGKAPNWESFGGGIWASASNYGSEIMSMYNEMMAFSMEPPSITSNPTQFNISLEQNATSPTYTFTITGKNLGTAMTHAKNSSVIKEYSVASNWSGTSGGTVSFTIDTSKSANTYACYIAFQSGSGDSKVRVEVPINVTITGPAEIKASPSSLSFNVAQNATVTPQTVKITASNLAKDLTVVSNTSKISFTQGSDWNARTGGTLSVTVDNKTVGTYSGYIAVQTSSTQRTEIPVTVTVTEPVSTDPELKANPASIDIEEYKDANPGLYPITVTGKNLTGDISYNSSSANFKVATASGWNARTGGTLNVSLNTGLAVGSYSGKIVIASSGQRVEVPVTGKVTEAPVVEPSITTTSSAVKLTAKQNATSPTTSVYVKAENLTADMSVAVSHGVFKYSPAPNWNARTGGNVIISLDTSKPVGTTTGYIVFAANGKRLEIPLTAVIEASATVTNPTLTVTPESFSLSAKQNATAPTATITVTGTDLTEDIAYRSSSSVITLAPAAGWNARTGGKLIATMNTASAVGNYNPNIFVTSGSLSKQISASVVVESAQATQVPALDFQEVWKTSDTNIRNLDYYNGKLYCVVNTNSIQVLDARAGTVIKTLDNGDVVSGGAAKLLDVKVLNGKIYASNVTSAAAKEYRVYVWDNDDATARLLMSTTDLQGCTRIGDGIDVTGTDGDLWITTAQGTSPATIVEYHVTSSGVTASKKAVTTDGSTALAIGSSSRARKLANGYYINAGNYAPMQLDQNGKMSQKFSAESVVSGNDFALFSYDGKDYMMLTTYLNLANTSLSDGTMRLYDISDGWSKATKVGDYPANGLGTSRNTTFSTSVRVNNCGDACVEAWVLIAGNGMAYYRSGTIGGGCTPDPGTDPVDPDPVDPDEDIALPSVFGEDWSYSQTNGQSATFMKPGDASYRNMVMKGDNLYIAQRGTSDCTIHIVDAWKGTAKGTLSNSGATASNYMYSSIANMGGTIIAVNMGFGGATVLRVYGWRNDTASPELILETADHGGARSGDLISASGTIDNGKIYLTNNDKSGRVLVYNVSGGKASSAPSQTIILKDASGAAYDLGGSFAVVEIKLLDDGTFQATGAGGTTAWFKADGSFIRQLDSAVANGNVAGTSTDVFTYGKYTLAATVNYTGANSQRTGGYLSLYDVTDHENPVKVHDFGVLGSTANGAIHTTAVAKVGDDNKIHLWVHVPYQGIAKYTCSTTSTVVNDQEIFVQPEIVYSLGTVKVMGVESVASLQVVNLSGSAVVSTADTSADLSALPHGVYIVVATLDNGQHLVAKVAL